MVVESCRSKQEAPQFSYSTERCFNGIDYLISIFTLKADLLEIEIEQKSDASRWKGEFNSKYLEEITAKTGNFKRYPVFVRMLRSALHGQSRSVTVEVLTYNDLEEMRRQRRGGDVTVVETSGLTAGQGLVPNNKRYLILTYASEFDRVHYPLPLSFEETPDPDRLRRVICDLRAEIESLRKAPTDASTLPTDDLSENITTLNSRTPKRFCLDNSGLNREIKLAYKERDVLRSRLESTQMELEQERCNHRRLMRKHNKDLEKLEDELKRSQLELKAEQNRNRELNRQLDGVQSQGRRIRASVPVSGSRLRRAKTDTPSSTPRTPLRRRSFGGSDREMTPTKGSGYNSSGSEKSRGCRSAGSSSRQRFNPTAYIQQRQEKLRNIQRQKRLKSPGFPSSRDSSQESRVSNTSKGQRSRKTMSRPTSAASRKSVQSVDSSPGRSQREMSPGRALQAIKEKLHKFASTPRGDSIEGSSSVAREADFIDVDNRLVTLQKFLQEAKTSMRKL